MANCEMAKTRHISFELEPLNKATKTSKSVIFTVVKLKGATFVKRRWLSGFDGLHLKKNFVFLMKRNGDVSG